MPRPSIPVLFMSAALVSCGSLKVPEDDPDQVEVVSTVTEGQVVDVELSRGVSSDSGLLGLIRPSMRNFDQDHATPEVGFGLALTNPIPLKFNFGFPIKEGEGDDTEVFSFRLNFR